MLVAVSMQDDCEIIYHGFADRHHGPAAHVRLFQLRGFLLPCMTATTTIVLTSTRYETLTKLKRHSLRRMSATASAANRPGFPSAS